MGIDPLMPMDQKMELMSRLLEGKSSGQNNRGHQQRAGQQQRPSAQAVTKAREKDQQPQQRASSMTKGTPNGQTASIPESNSKKKETQCLIEEVTAGYTTAQADVGKDASCGLNDLD